MLLNQWGYAPLFMTHGLSGFFTLNHYYAKQDMLQGKSIPLDSLFNSASYRRQDQKRAFNQAASWTRFLIENFTQQKVIQFYREVSDINVKELTEKYFGNLDQLQTKWRDFLKDYWPTAEDLHFFAKLATGMGDYPTALKLYQELDRSHPEHKTSTDLGNAYYLTGDYLNALVNFKKWMAEDSVDPNRHFVLGNIFWLNGNLAEAEREYLRASQLDSSFGSAFLALARLYWDGKDTLKCGQFLKRIPGQKIDRVEETEFNLLQVEYLQSKNQTAAADSLAQNARNLAKYLVNQAPEQSPAYLLMGKAYLACDSLERAQDYLEVAHLLEDRPYYQGQVYLSLAELYLKLQDARQAKLYLGEVLSTPAGYREKNIAQKLFSGL
jgi:tetratricopeptide (TPR) repeat protein